MNAGGSACKHRAAIWTRSGGLSCFGGLICALGVPKGKEGKKELGKNGARRACTKRGNTRFEKRRGDGVIGRGNQKEAQQKKSKGEKGRQGRGKIGWEKKKNLTGENKWKKILPQVSAPNLVKGANSPTCASQDTERRGCCRTTGGPHFLKETGQQLARKKKKVD